MTMNPDGGVPREKIPWFPTINRDLCTNCNACIDYCRNSCYATENAETKVVAPFNCVVGCSSCESECAEHAISFPVMEEFMLVLGELRMPYPE
jgi:Pyruvate/2-oxoacid:ferredoxin oxidoreductase delta subunit